MRLVSVCLFFSLLLLGQKRNLHAMEAQYSNKTVKIYSDDPAPIGGQNYTLLCNISDGVQTYEHQWKRNGTLSSEPSLYFSPLSLSDGGVYICESAISPEVNDTIDLVVQIPAPVSVIVRSNKSNPIRPIASDVSLQCDVELSVLGSHVPLTVNVIWIGPNSEVPIATNRTLLSEGMRNTSIMITVHSFGRLDSGNYSCTAFLSSTSLLLNTSQSLSSTIMVTTGVYLSLGRRFYRNNSVIPIIDVIGDGNLVLSDSALQCVTDRKPCCYNPSNRHGEWYFPDGRQIPNNYNAKASNLPFFRNRGDGGTVHLNRVRNSIMSPTGKFCCKVPDAIGVSQTLCAILIAAQIEDDIATGGTEKQNISVVCTLSGAEDVNNTIDLILYQWIKNNGSQTEDLVVSNSNTLSFSLLEEMDFGQYTCKITVNSSLLIDGTATIINTYDIGLPEIISTHIESDPVSPIRPVGSRTNISIYLNLSTYSNIPVTVHTAWSGPNELVIKNTATLIDRENATTPSPTYISMISITNFQRTHSGLYYCTASVLFSFSKLSDGNCNTARIRIIVGVYLSLKQMLHYTNGTIFPITEIGKTNTSTASSVVHENNALQCITDKPSCCKKNIGEWYYPSGERVDAIDPSTNDSTVTFYQNRGPNDGTVNLNYINMHKSNINLNSLTGEFCCVIPDAINFMRKICANIVDVYISTNHESPSVGQHYEISCDAQGVQHNSGINITYTWIKNNETIPTKLNTLYFSHIKMSDAGHYICITSLWLNNQSQEINATHDLYLQAPDPVDVRVTSSPSSPIRSIGSNIILMCSVELSLGVDAPVNLNIDLSGPGNWSTNESLLIHETSATINATITPFGSSQSGNYSCTVTVHSTSPFHTGFGSLARFAEIVTVTAPTSAVDNLTTIPGIRSVQLSWLPPSDTDPAAIVESYNLTCIPQIADFVTIRRSYSQPGMHTIVGFSPATEYNCSIVASNNAGYGPSTMVNVITMDEFKPFQLKLTGIQSCIEWVKEDTVKKVDFITLEVFNHLRVHCNCGFAQSMMITSGVFSCFETGSVHFRAYVHGTVNATAAALIQHIQRWVNGGAVLTVDFLQLRVDNTCTVAIPSIAYNNDGCESLIVSPDEPTRTSPLGLTEILVTLILSVSIVLLITVIVVVAFLALKKLSHTRIERGSVSTISYWKQSVQLPTDHDATSEYPFYDQLSTFQQLNKDSENHEDYNIGSCPAYDAVSAQSQL